MRQLRKRSRFCRKRRIHHRHLQARSQVTVPKMRAHLNPEIPSQYHVTKSCPRACPRIPEGPLWLNSVEPAYKPSSVPPARRQPFI